MTEALSRRVINIVESVEQLLRDAPFEGARIRDETDRALRELQSELSGAERGVKPDPRPYSVQRELEFAYRQTPGFSGAATHRGKARQAPDSADELRREYDALLEQTVTAVRAQVAVLEAWKRKGKIARAFTRSRRPQLPDQSMCDDIMTLIRWVRPLVTLEHEQLQARLQARRNREEAEIRGRGASRLDELMLEQSAQLERLRRELAEAVRLAGLTALPWGDPEWGNFQPPSRLRTDLRVGEYEVKAPNSAGKWEAPATISFPFPAGLVVDCDTASRSRAVELARSLCVRLLAAVPPGRLRFTFIDPVSLGQSVADFQHLADFDPELVGIRPLTGARDIEGRLADLSAHIETVISKYLRGQFHSIDDYNEAAGELAEPYRVLVVFDYPAGFTETAAQQLLSLVENGPRCGLHTIVVADESREQPRDLPLARLRHGMQRVSWAGSKTRLTLAAPIGAVAHDVAPDVSPPVTFDADGRAASPFAKLLVAVGEGSRTVGAEAVTLSRLLPVLNRLVGAGRSRSVPQLPSGAPPISRDPATWWTASTADNTVAVLGKSGAQDLASMYFSSTEIAGGAIMVGLPRSGKTTSLHAAILTMCMLYSPGELELFLIDAKHGVEFKVYEHLPHARMVSIHSEREFSVAVLRSIDHEIARRAELMKSHSAGRANISEYRSATGQSLPRIVLVMDEFHEIFEEDDTLGHEAFQAFSNIVRQGPFAGVHVVVSSQTLSSMPALDRPTLQLLPQRIAFMCNETDADVVMGDLNKGARLLNRQGEGLFNPSRGEPSQNKPFQGLFIPPDERDCMLAALAALASRAGWTRVPRVFDGDASASRAIAVRGDTSTNRPAISLGEPFTLQPVVVVTLRRSRGSNIVFVGDVDDEAVSDLSVRGAVHSTVAAACRSAAHVSVVDFIGDEITDPYATVAHVARAFGADYYRGRDLPTVVGDVATIVEKRLADADYSAPTEFLVLFGVQRALSMKPADPYDDDVDAQTGTQLARILRDGPEVGVHVAISADSVASLERRIGSDLYSELAVRVGGALASPGDLQFVTGTYGTPPTVRRHQLVLGDQQRGVQTRMRAYPPYSYEELATGTRP